MQVGWWSREQGQVPHGKSGVRPALSTLYICHALMGFSPDANAESPLGSSQCSPPTEGLVFSLMSMSGPESAPGSPPLCPMHAGCFSIPP